MLGCFHIIDEIVAVTSSRDEFTSTDSILIDLLTTLFVDSAKTYCYDVFSPLFITGYSLCCYIQRCASRNTVVSKYGVLAFFVDNVIDLYTTFLCNSLSSKVVRFQVMYSIEGIVAVVTFKDKLLGTSRYRNIAFSMILID